jgi:hypothetical protein
MKPIRIICWCLGGHKGPYIEVGRTSDRVCLLCGAIFTDKRDRRAYQQMAKPRMK